MTTLRSSSTPKSTLSALLAVLLLLVPLLLPADAAAQGDQGLVWDVPIRGAHVFDRQSRFDISPPPTRMRTELVVAGGADADPCNWRMLTTTAAQVPADWQKPAFDDSSWASGRGKFEMEVDAARGHQTRWNTEVLCLRTRIELPKKPRAVQFVVDHDDQVRIWLNGKLLVADDGNGRGRRFVVFGPELDAWQRDNNVLAAQCTNLGGLQYFDLQMTAFGSLPPGVRDDEGLRKLLREEGEAANRVRGDLFGAYRPPALLMHGDLDAAGQGIQQAPSDLRELLWFAAMNLRPGVLGGTVQIDAPRMYEVGDLQLRGKADAVDADGWQNLQLAWKTNPETSLRGDSKRWVQEHVNAHLSYATDGEMTLRRRLEMKGKRARVVEFTGSATGRLRRGRDSKEPVATFAQQETWRLVKTRDGQDAEFRQMVTEALARGTARLREQLKNATGGILAAQPADGDNSYHSGRLAIGLLALLKGGVPKDDEVVVAGLAELRKRTLIDTYSLANAIMAIEALYIPAGEVADLRSGAIDRPRQRTPSPSDKALLQKWTDRLLTNVDTRTDLAYLMRFNYTGGPRFDNSVNQYGLLGLYSAHLCGIPVKGSLWEAAANHLLQCQGAEGPKVDLELIDYRTYARRLADPDAQVTSSRSNQRANAWNYYEMKHNGTMMPGRGSMVCAGLTGLAICQAAITDQPNMKRPKLFGDINRARGDGFAWLALNMTARFHPGELPHQQRWFYYYLYGLERASLLSGVALIQNRDWYFEGAMVLVLAQQADGNWPGELHWDQEVERNAMAILFLKRGTAPVLTGK